MNDYTFGYARAEVNLAKILTDYNNKKYNSLVSRSLNTFNNESGHLSALNVAGDTNRTEALVILQLKLLFLIFKENRQTIRDSDLPENVKTHTLNSLTGRYRMMQRIFVNRRKRAVKYDAVRYERYRQNMAEYKARK